MATKDMGQICDMNTITVDVNGWLQLAPANFVDNTTIEFKDGKLTLIAQPTPEPQPTPEQPEYAMTNTVWKDADGNVVSEGTVGATRYKVLTFWCEGGLADGLEWLGLSNSEWCATGANGTQDIEVWTGGDNWDSALINVDNTAVLWLCAASNFLNAYDRNYLWNLWCASTFGQNAGAEPTEWFATNFVLYRWATEAGVFEPLKYRPEMLFLQEDQQETFGQYTNEIRNFIYRDSEGGEPFPDDQKDDFYAPDDENYDPTIFGNEYTDPFSQLNVLRDIAENAQNRINDTQDRNGIGDNEVLTWKTVQQLPLENRKSIRAYDMALYAEALIKGAMWYTRKCISEGEVQQKRVAFLHEQIDEATINIMHPQFSTPATGKISFAALLVDDPVNDDSNYMLDVDPITKITMPTYYEDVHADYLCECDVLVEENLGMSEQALRDWLKQFASTLEGQEAADDIKICASLADGNYLANNSISRLANGLFLLDFIYPEIWSDMSLSCAFWDMLASVASSVLAQVMMVQYGNYTLPQGVNLSNIPANYNQGDVWGKICEGLQWWESNADELNDRLQDNRDALGRDEMNGVAYNFESYRPSEDVLAFVRG